MATGYIPANTVAAFYRLMPSNVDKAKAEQLWKRLQAGDFDNLLKQLGISKPTRKGDKKKWDANVACVNNAECFEKIRKLYEAYTLDPFVPDLSFGIPEGGSLMYGLEPFTFSLPYLNGASYTAVYPPLNGIFSNEPAVGTVPNAEAVFPPELLGLTSDKPTEAEAVTMYTPLVYLRTTQPVEKGEHLTWCYGSQYTDRGYLTPCSTTTVDGRPHPSQDAKPAVRVRPGRAGGDESVDDPTPPEKQSQPSEYVYDAITVLFLLDTSGRIATLKKIKIPDPETLRRLHEAASEAGDTPSLTRPMSAIPGAGPSTTVLRAFTVGM